MASPEEATVTVAGSSLTNVNLEDLNNVDEGAGLVDNDMLFYNAETGQWEMINKTDLNLDGGSF
jgi:spore coat protein CotH